MRGLMGSFSLMPLREVVEFLARTKVTASLACERGAVRKTCHVVEGVIVEASSNDPREYLGQLLINFGHLHEAELAHAFEQQQQTKVRLGRVLVTSGAVTAEVVRDTLAIKIRETLLDAFLWDAGFFRVEAGPPRPQDQLDARVPLTEVVREAEFRAPAWQAFRAAFPAGGATLEVDEARAPANLDPATVNGRILRLAREGRTIDEIALALHATDFHLYQRLYALQSQGVIRAIPERPSAAPEEGAEGRLADARAHLAARRVAEAEQAADEALAMDPALSAAAELRDQARAALYQALGARFLSPPRRPALLVSRHEIASLPVSALEKWLLAHCDGRRDVGALVRLGPASELEVLKALGRFVDRRIVTVA
jgi:hypothetical protein